MRFYNGLSAAIAGTAIVSAMVIVQPRAAHALSGEEINDIARDVTVLIRGEKSGHGSGVLIAKDGNTYYALTAYHVVSDSDKYRIVTSDKQAHEMDYSKVKRLPNVDLAVVQFQSDKTYKLAKLANSDTTKQGATVFVSGWPAPGQAIKEVVRQFTTGNVSERLDKPVGGGYQMVYTNVTRRGMSGGPVFDTAGRVVAIHGLAEGEDANAIKSRLGLASEAEAAKFTQIAGKPGFNMAVPINTFLSLAPQSGLYLGLQVENSPPAQPTSTTTTTTTQTDERDRVNVDNLFQRVLENTLERGIQRILPF
ncbi:S1 family peptidase [Pseudanabaena sp. PCC 6802]|uniref:S1 family peptidase n=1 Tax=Pseudanabaena sp. PCC 6802 TaxID=118173 RepID=UPI00034951CD|nr:serine protease [Pseudanabaena sp. PCC 6802]